MSEETVDGASEEQYRLIVEGIPHLVWVSRPDGATEYWNGRYRQYTGVSLTEARGSGWQRVIHPDDLPTTTRDWDHSLSSGEPCYIEQRIRRADGTYRWHSTRAVPLRDGRGQIVRWLGTCTDIDEQKRLEEQLRQAQKMEAIGQLAGGVAHDFNNLLCIINGYSDLVYGALRPDDPLRDLVDEIRKAGERSASLTRQLLAFSRKQVIAPKVLDLNSAVLDLEKMLRRVIGEDIDLATRLAPSLGSIKADPCQIEQVLLNMVVNARDAMPRGGKLTIETQNVNLDESFAQTHSEVHPGPFVRLAVSDTGCGMTPEVKARIFEPFYTTKGQGKGTGLGLATVFGIVKQGGGHIEVYSEPGIGTTFKVYFPVVQGAVSTRKSRAGTSPGARGSETILLVEDDEGVRTLTRHLLQGDGYSVLVAREGEEALRICRGRREPIDLLVSDVVMPGLGGRQLSEQLLLLHPEMKVLFLSGYTDDAVVRHGVLEEEANFLQKPFSPSALAQKVRDVLDEFHQEAISS